MYGLSFYATATGSDATSLDFLDIGDFEEFLINDLETGLGVSESEGNGYTGQIMGITALLLFHIFFMGITCGLIFSKILWGRIK